MMEHFPKICFCSLFVIIHNSLGCGVFDIRVLYHLMSTNGHNQLSNPNLQSLYLSMLNRSPSDCLRVDTPVKAYKKESKVLVYKKEMFIFNLSITLAIALSFL